MKLHVPSGPFDAFLFDCDGTLADSMPLHRRAWVQAVGEWGCEFPEDLFLRLGGVPIPRTVELLNEKYGLRMEPDRVASRREELYLALIAEVEPIPAVVEHVHAQFGKVPLAVVSGSTRESVRRTLEAIRLTSYFATVVGAEDYCHGKPHPEPFLVAARRLGVEPARCLVFEDGELGIQSAEAAGMQWVRVPATGR